jgi:hypothetical protein
VPVPGPTEDALAGPNAGGTLIVHDTGLAFTNEYPDQCSQLGGTFYGHRTGSDPTPCPPPTPVEESSWGWIKRRCRAE